MLRRVFEDGAVGEGRGSIDFLEALFAGFPGVPGPLPWVR